MVSCKLSSRYLLGLYALKDIHVIYTYVFCDSLWPVLLCDVSSICVNMYTWFLGFYVFEWTFLSKVSGSVQFTMEWSSDPHLEHIFCFQPLRSVCLLLDLREFNGALLLTLYFICHLNNFSVGCEPPHRLHLEREKFPLSVFITEFYKFK